jgi:hypothetical protein
MLHALLQRVVSCGYIALPVSLFRGATGQIRASGAIAEAHLDLQTSAPRARPPIVTSSWRDTIEFIPLYGMSSAVVS